MGTRLTPLVSSPARVLANYPGLITSSGASHSATTPSSSAPTAGFGLAVSSAAVSSAASSSASGHSSSAPVLSLGASAPSTGISSAEVASLHGFLQSQLDNFKQQMVASLQMKLTPPSPAPAASANRLSTPTLPPFSFAPSSSASSSTAAATVPASLLANPFGGSSTWSAGAFGPQLASAPLPQVHVQPTGLGVGDQDGSDVEEVIDRILAAHEKSINPSAIHPPPQVTSEVMGASNLIQDCDVDTLRDSKIVALQSSMTSPDKKRLARYLSTLSYSLADIRSVIARSAMMFPFRDLATLARASDRQQVEDLWRRDQELVSASLDSMQEKLRGLTAHLHLANDKALNPYGFATIDRMEKMVEMEKVATKGEIDAFKQALITQDKANASSKRKRSRPANNKNGRNKKNKPNPNSQPDLARCAACNKLGHVAGDARCKAAPRPPQT